MPTYVYHCSCGETAEAFNRVADRHTNAPSHCGAPMEIVLQPAMVRVQAEAHYVCPATGTKITSRRQRAYVMEKHGLIDADDVNPGLAAAQDKRHAEDARIAKECREGLSYGQRRALQEAYDQNTPG